MQNERDPISQRRLSYEDCNSADLSVNSIYQAEMTARQVVMIVKINFQKKVRPNKIIFRVPVSY